MVDALTLALSVVRLGVCLLGLSVTRVSYVAYRRSGEPFLRDATIGFAAISVGVFVEGVLFNGFALDLTTAHIVESLTVGLGLLVLHRSFHR